MINLILLNPDWFLGVTSLVLSKLVNILTSHKLIS